MFECSELLKRTDGLQRAAKLRQFFASPPVTEVGVLEVFRRVSAHHDGRLTSTLRAYQGGRREELEHRVLTRPPPPDASLGSWYRDTFLGQPSALILNRVERWSIEVANFAAELNLALAGGNTSNLYSIECVLLIGDYGFSPFGVHVDHDSIGVLHVPLSTELKTMYLWSRSAFEEATGDRTPCFNPQQLLHCAECHEFTAGDLFFLPPDVYHIGYSPVLTATLGVVLKKPAPVPPLVNLPEALASTFGPEWVSMANLRDFNLNELLRLGADYARLQRASNMGLSAHVEYEAHTLPRDRDVFLRLVRPFKLHCGRHYGMTVHARGTSFALHARTNPRHLQDLIELIEVLNTGEVLSINLATHITRTLDADALAHFIGLLARRHAVEAVAT